jgi:uncharacterized protein
MSLKFGHAMAEFSDRPTKSNPDDHFELPLNDMSSATAPEADSQPWFPRVADALLSEYLALFPIVVVTGARRTGKSTLVRGHADAQAWPYRSLDELDLRLAAEAAPQEFASAAVPGVIDEVQRVPAVVLAIKAIVDRARDAAPGRFILTGSANLLSHPDVGDSLAGRAGYLRLGPLTRQERLGIPSAGRWSELFDRPAAEWAGMLREGDAAPEDWRAAVRLGGLPQVVRAGSDAARARLLLGYVDTYLERDLRDLSQVDQLPDFRRVMRAAALRTGGLLNVAELARDVGVPATTVKRWLDLLEISYLVVRVEAWTTNRTSRLMKSPKLYWCDTALGLFVADAPEPAGAHLENLVLSDLLVWRELYAPRPGVFHWRATSGREVDFVLERQNRVLPVEVKATTRPVPADWKHLRAFLDEYGDLAIGALLLHCGDEVMPVADRIVAAPWWRVL